MGQATATRGPLKRMLAGVDVLANTRGAKTDSVDPSQALTSHVQSDLDQLLSLEESTEQHTPMSALYLASASTYRAPQGLAEEVKKALGRAAPIPPGADRSYQSLTTSVQLAHARPSLGVTVRHGRELADYVLDLLSSANREQFLHDVLYAACESLEKLDWWPLAETMNGWEATAEVDEDAEFAAAVDEAIAEYRAGK